jgi:predicted AAA+ superfamily ATPase
MKQISRPVQKTIVARLKEPRSFIQVLVGPRQVGKTTMAKQLLKSLDLPGNYITADNISNADGQWLSIQWETARIMQKQAPRKPYILIIDEIQKIGNWSEVVKQQWDQDTADKTPIKVLLLGSSRILMQQGLTESLLGRFEKHYITHWSFSEMQEAFNINLNEYIWFGAYPGAAGIMRDEERWKSYISDAIIEPAISKDILMLTRIDKPALMKKLFELGCSYSGQILSFTKILGQLKDAGNTTTLSNYINLLETAGLLSGLEKFSFNKIRQRSASPKFLVQNTALMSAYYPHTLKEAMADRQLWGRITESAVGAYLYNQSIEGRYSVTYWREGNEEVDFVLQKDKKIICIEVKSNIEKRPVNNASFMKQYPKAKTILIGGSGIPLETFFRMDVRTLF